MLSTGEAIFIGAVALVLLAAIISNIGVIIIVIKDPKLRNLTNVFICNLAVSDILLSGVVLPQRLHDISHSDNYSEGMFLCKLVNFSPLFCIVSSMYSMVVISFERFRALTVQTSPYPTLKVAAICIPSIWIGSLLVSVPTMYEYTELASTEVMEDNATVYLVCGSGHVSQTFKTTNAVMLVLVAYVIPLVLIVVNYTRIAAYFWRQKLIGGTSTAPNAQKHKVKTLKMLILVAAVFALSWLPYFCLLILEKLTGRDHSGASGGWLNMLRISFATASTGYNAVLYIIFNRNFRQGFRKLFCKCLLRRQSRIGSLDRQLDVMSSNAPKLNAREATIQS